MACGDRQVADDQCHRVGVSGGGEVVTDREEHLAEHRLAEDPSVERVVVRRCVAGSVRCVYCTDPQLLPTSCILLEAVGGYFVR